MYKLALPLATFFLCLAAASGCSDTESSPTISVECSRTTTDDINITCNPGDDNNVGTEPAARPDLASVCEPTLQLFGAWYRNDGDYAHLPPFDTGGAGWIWSYDIPGSLAVAYQAVEVDIAFGGDKAAVLANGQVGAWIGSASNPAGLVIQPVAATLSEERYTVSLSIDGAHYAEDGFLRVDVQAPQCSPPTECDIMIAAAPRLRRTCD